MTNKDMKEVFNQVEVGTPVVIIGSEGFTQTYTELRASRPWRSGKAS